MTASADIPDTDGEHRHPYGPCHHTKYEGCPPCVHSAWDEGLQAARDTVLAYADDTQKRYGDLFGQCREEYGDRCDITAALRVAAERIDALRGES